MMTIMAELHVAEDDDDGCHAKQKQKLPRRTKKPSVERRECLGYFWLLQLRADGVLPQSTTSKMSWLDFLCQKNMGTKGLVSFYDRATGSSGCFCVLKTARSLEGVDQKLGYFCTAQKLPSAFASEHPLYLEYGRRGLLCMEQKGIPDVLVDMRVADRPPPILLEGCHSASDDDDDDECGRRGGVQRKEKNSRSFACQVHKKFKKLCHKISKMCDTHVHTQTHTGKHGCPSRAAPCGISRGTQGAPGSSLHC